MQVLLSLFKPFKGLLLIIGLLSLVNVAATLYVPTLTASILNDGVLQGDIDFIYANVSHMLLASVITVLTAILSSYVCAHVATRVGFDLRNRLTKAIASDSMNDFKSFGAGTLTIRMTHDVERIQSVLGEAFSMVLPTPLMIIMGLYLSFQTNMVLGCIVIAVMVTVVLSTVLIQYFSLPYVRQVQEQLDIIADLVKEHVVGMRVIRAFNRGSYEENRENKAFDDVAQRSMSMACLNSFMLPAIIIVFNISSVILIWAGGYQVEAGHIQVGQIIAVVEYALQILLALTMAVFVFMDIPEAIIGFKRIQEVLHHPVTDVAEVSKATQCQLVSRMSRQSFLGACSTDETVLEVKHLTFRYQDAEMPALYDVSFRLRAGQSLAIMGNIGAGKSTLVHLLLGLAPIDFGDISLMGQSMYQQSLESVRSHIAYVPQKAFLFTGSIKENLLHGIRGIEDLDGAGSLRQRMDQALRVCQAYDFVHEFPEVYDYQIVQGGTNVSGGQRQRLAMARAIMRKANLYIFDDSFSALDGTTERQVRRALKALLGERENTAMISVEQKVSSAKEADSILVLENGRVVGWGTHEELLASCSVYQQIVASQEVAV